MSEQNQNQQVSDDQELAKVLQGMQQQTRSMAGSDPQAKEKDGEKAKDQAAPAPGASDLKYEETPQAGGSKEAAPEAAKADAPAQATAPAPAASPQAAQTPAAAQQPAAGQPAEPQREQQAPSLPSPAATPKAANPGLESLKKEALEELRPLVDKLDLPPKEKFDTMLLIIRSTDDEELLQPAHEAAKEIEDENQRAEALLDIVKEVDYFAGQK